MKTAKIKLIGPEISKSKGQLKFFGHLEVPKSQNALGTS